MKPGILWAFGKLQLVAGSYIPSLSSPNVPKSMAHTKEGARNRH